MLKAFELSEISACQKYPLLATLLMKKISAILKGFQIISTKLSSRTHGAVIQTNFGFIVSNFNSIAMEPLGHVAGSAAAVMGGVHFAVGALIGGFVGQMFDGSIIPLASAYCVVGVFALVVIAITERGRFFGA